MVALLRSLTASNGHPLAINPSALKRSWMLHSMRSMALLSGTLSLMQSSPKLAEDAASQSAPQRPGHDPYITALEKPSSLRRSLTRMTKSLSACVITAVAHTLDGTAKPALEHALELVSLELGINSPMQIQVSAQGHVLKVKLSSALNFNISDKAELLLTEQLRSRNITAFKQSLATLSFLDRFSAQPQYNLFDAQSCIETDLNAIFQLEINISNGALLQVLLNGHGIPRMYADRWGPSILYWCSPFDAPKLAQELASQLDSAVPSNLDAVFTAFLTLEDSPPSLFLPSNYTQYLVTDQTQLGSLLRDGQSYTTTRFVDLDMSGNQQSHVYSVPSLAGSDQTGCYLVSRIPFLTPASIRPIFMILRRHLAFEFLIKSLFNAHRRDTVVNGKFGSSDNTSFALILSLELQLTPAFSQISCHAVESSVLTFDLAEISPPSQLAFIFMHSVAPYIFRIEICLAEDCSVQIQLYGGHARHDGEPTVSWIAIDLGQSVATQLNALASTTLDLPRIIRSMLGYLTTEMNPPTQD
eukprot:jgi/Hompol1/1665/HPOL_002741-RA